MKTKLLCFSILLTASAFAKANTPEIGALYYGCAGVLVEKDVVLTTTACINPYYSSFYPSIDSSIWTFKKSIGYSHYLLGEDYAVLKLKEQTKANKHIKLDQLNLDITQLTKDDRLIVKGYTDGSSKLKTMPLNTIDVSKNTGDLDYKVKEEEMSTGVIYKVVDNKLTPIGLQTEAINYSPRGTFVWNLDDSHGRAFLFTPEKVLEIKQSIEELNSMQ